MIEQDGTPREMTCAAAHVWREAVSVIHARLRQIGAEAAAGVASSSGASTITKTSSDG